MWLVRELNKRLGIKPQRQEWEIRTNDIYITGADVAQQFLKRGLIDEISIHLVPVLFGRGTRLFECLNSEHILLEIIEVIQTAEAIHLRFRVIL
jgi:riboflavin biosynthesis pyrimidine reductase